MRPAQEIIQEHVTEDGLIDIGAASQALAFTVPPGIEVGAADLLALQQAHYTEAILMLGSILFDTLQGLELLPDGVDVEMQKLAQGLAFDYQVKQYEMLRHKVEKASGIWTP